MPAKRDRRLWHRLEGYSFHERPLSRSLVDTLEEKTGHSTDICYTLVEEYRRFMYLMGSTGETLSPSPIIDMVWQLHIADEDAYFKDFCPRIIGRTIHHSPDRLPLQDDPAYERTLEYYAQEFGRPQVQYWPEPDVSTVRLSTALLCIMGVVAFALSAIFESYVFAIFGICVIVGSVFLHWKFSSLPLRNTKPEGD